MRVNQLNWKKMAQLFGGVALVALIQTGLMFSETQDFVGTWTIVTLFGAVYAAVGATTWTTFEKRRRQSS